MNNFLILALAWAQKVVSNADLGSKNNLSPWSQIKHGSLASVLGEQIVFRVPLAQCISLEFFRGQKSYLALV